jgi:hypothetical protein
MYHEAQSARSFFNSANHGADKKRSCAPQQQRQQHSTMNQAANAAVLSTTSTAKSSSMPSVTLWFEKSVRAKFLENHFFKFVNAILTILHADQEAQTRRNRNPSQA